MKLPDFFPQAVSPASDPSRKPDIEELISGLDARFSETDILKLRHSSEFIAGLFLGSLFSLLILPLVFVFRSKNLRGGLLSGFLFSILFWGLGLSTFLVYRFVNHSTD